MTVKMSSFVRKNEKKSKKSKKSLEKLLTNSETCDKIGVSLTAARYLQVV